MNSDISVVIGTLALVVLLFATFPVKAQEENSPVREFSVGLAPNGGFVIPHRNEMRHLIQGHTTGLALTVNWRTTGKEYWQQKYLDPTLGVDVFINDLGNREQLGIASSAIFFIQLPLKKSEKFRQYLKPGIGVGYLTRKYDLETNSRHLAIGSRVNGAVLLEYGCEIWLTKNFSLLPGIRMTHFSNGAYQKPNLGLNIPSVFIGAKWVTREGEKSDSRIEEQKSEKMAYTSFAGFGLKENLPPGGPKYLAYTWSNMAEWRVSFKSSVAGGVDLMYNNALVNRDKEHENFIVPDTKIQIGALIGYSLHLHKFRIIIQAGTYVLDKFNVEGNIYNRFGLRYQISDHFEAGLHLKTHIIVADYFEAGLAYRF